MAIQSSSNRRNNHEKIIVVSAIYGKFADSYTKRWGIYELVLRDIRTAHGFGRRKL